MIKNIISITIVFMVLALLSSCSKEFDGTPVFTAKDDDKQAEDNSDRLTKALKANGIEINLIIGGTGRITYYVKNSDKQKAKEIVSKEIIKWSMSPGIKLDE